MASHLSPVTAIATTPLLTPRELLAQQRRAWFVAAENGDAAAMAQLLAQQPALIDATEQLQVRCAYNTNLALSANARTLKS